TTGGSRAGSRDSRPCRPTGSRHPPAPQTPAAAGHPPPAPRPPPRCPAPPAAPARRRPARPRARHRKGPPPTRRPSSARAPCPRRPLSERRPPRPEPRCFLLPPLARSALCLRRRRHSDLHPCTIHRDLRLDLVAGLDSAQEDRLRQRIIQVALDRTAKRQGAEVLVEAVIHQELHRAVRQPQLQILIRQ